MCYGQNMYYIVILEVTCVTMRYIVDVLITLARTYVQEDIVLWFIAINM